MVDTISLLRTAIDDRLSALRGVMTDDPIEVVAENYQRWKHATRAALAGLVLESVVARFDSARGFADQVPGRRPTPLVFLDGAASRAFLQGLKKQMEADPKAVLSALPSGPLPEDPLGDLREVLDLLERRLPHAFRGRPAEERHLQLGFETLLAGSAVRYEMGGGAADQGSRTITADFTFPDLNAALRFKLCDGPGRGEAILAEILDEIGTLMTKYERIIFAVCDLGFIGNRAGMVERFVSDDRVVVRVLALD